MGAYVFEEMFGFAKSRVMVGQDLYFDELQIIGPLNNFVTFENKEVDLYSLEQKIIGLDVGMLKVSAGVD